MRRSLQPASNVNSERLSQSANALAAMWTTEEGMQIAEIDEHFENAKLSMTKSLEALSKVTADRFEHSEKQ
jgi:hypothetical protein